MNQNQARVTTTVVILAFVVVMFGVLALNGLYRDSQTAAKASQTPSTAPVAASMEPTVVEKEVIKEVVVAEIPAVCFDALDRADEAFAYTGEVFGVVSEVLNAMGDLDLATMEKSVDKLGEMREELTGKLEIYKTARDACRVNAKR